MNASVPGIDYRFRDPRLLQEALTHRSAGPKNYERLEFLGDSVLNLVISQRLYERFPSADEGDLSRMRARVVRGRTLAEVATRLQLGKWLILGQGEINSGGIRRSSILADALESLIGAILLDGGLEACEQAIAKMFYPLIDELPAADQLKDAKTRLQEWLQARQAPLPEYRLLAADGEDHDKTFRVLCVLTTPALEQEGAGSSRRQAEQAAALNVLSRIDTSA
jgi:ribonuclease-3